MKTYAEVLTAAKSAQIVTFYRPSCKESREGVLSLVLDDRASDRRTCVEIRMGSGRSGTIELKTLCGYNAEKHRWEEYCAPSVSVSIETRAGQKALLTWIKETSQKLTGWPAAGQWSLYAN